MSTRLVPLHRPCHVMHAFRRLHSVTSASMMASASERGHKWGVGGFLLSLSCMCAAHPASPEQGMVRHQAVPLGAPADAPICCKQPETMTLSTHRLHLPDSQGQPAPCPRLLPPRARNASLNLHEQLSFLQRALGLLPCTAVIAHHWRARTLLDHAAKYWCDCTDAADSSCCSRAAFTGPLSLMNVMRRGWHGCTVSMLSSK